MLEFCLSVKGKYVEVNKVIVVGILRWGVDFVSDKRRDQSNIALGKMMQSLTNGD
jgi:hypothetical protein